MSLIGAVLRSFHATRHAIFDRFAERALPGTFEPEQFDQGILRLVRKLSAHGRHPARRAALAAVPPEEMLVAHPAFCHEVRDGVLVERSAIYGIELRAVLFAADPPGFELTVRKSLLDF